MIRIPVFRIFYSTTFSILLILTLALLAVSPADGIYQSYTHDQGWSIIIIAGVYLAICIVTLFIYATRLYTTRTTLAAIPKSRLPLQKGDLPRSVRRLVLSGIERSASIAFRVRPRDLTEERRAKHPNDDDAREKPKSKAAPTWGHLSHPGWAAPEDIEAPDMHYTPVLQELPYLLEARAVSLAPPASVDMSAFVPRDELNEGEVGPTPDPTAMALLQRPPSASLRTYIGRLVDLGVLEGTEFANDFVSRYEPARFSGAPLHDRDFRSLMESFALLLDSMREPDQNVLNAMAEGSDAISSIASIKVTRQRRPVEHKLSATSLTKDFGTSRASRGRLAPPRLDWAVDRSRSTSRHSHGTTGSDKAFATPALAPNTPFYTPYPEPTSAKTASTGSLAGSEGTSRSVPNLTARRSASKKRNLSAFSRRSSGRPETSRKVTPQGVDGLGLDFRDDEMVSEADQGSTGSVRVNESRRSSTDLDSIEMSGEENLPRTEGAGPSERNFDTEDSREDDGYVQHEQSEHADSEDSVVRRRARRPQPGMLSLG